MHTRLTGHTGAAGTISHSAGDVALSLQNVIRYSAACDAARRHQQTAVTEQIGPTGQPLHLSCRTGTKSELVVVVVAWLGPCACCLQSDYTK